MRRRRPPARRQRLLASGDGNENEAGWTANFDEATAEYPVLSARWSVPLDDTETMMIRMTFRPAANPGRFRRTPYTGEWKAVEVRPYKEYRTTHTPASLGYEMPSVVPTEDATIIDSMEKVVDREP